MFRAVDTFLDHITMYRLVLYYLIGLLLAALGLSLFGNLHYGFGYILLSTAILVIACWIINKVLASFLDVPVNPESSLITALILALIIAPISSLQPTNVTFLLAVSGLAMASKYILTIGNKHIFNPAAIAVVLTALGPHQSANWWAGTTSMLPFVLIGGFLVVRKIRRGGMVVTFFIATLTSAAFYTLVAHGSMILDLRNTVMTSAMLFLGFVMLTEPLTTPPTTRKQLWYGVLVGALFPPQVHLFHLYSTPELALVVGNIFSFIISPKAKLTPKLIQKRRITPDSVDFIFDPGRPFAYSPGQYMEWTLPHQSMDNRGARRYLTLASSPTEPTIRIGVKFYERSSSFKRALLATKRDTPIVATQVAGDFVLPKDPGQKLVFIAGGIGITPYRSMIKYLLDTNEQRSIVLIYSARTPADLAYRDVFEQAVRAIGLKTVYTVTDPKTGHVLPDIHRGYITADMIKREAPDFQERLFYVSGTHALVTAVKDMLGDMGLPSNQVKEDFFSGYA